MNEEQYKKVCEACDRLLKVQNLSLERVSISWLHVLNEHPINLLHYAHLFNLKDSTAIKIIDEIKNLFVVIKVFINSFFSVRQTMLPQKADVLIISHLINSSHWGACEDFYFGELPEKLIANKFISVVALRNQMTFRQKFLYCLWPNEMAKRFLFSQKISLKDVLRLKKRLREEAFILKNEAKYTISEIDKRICVTAAKHAVSRSAIENLKFYEQVQEIVKRLKPKSIVVTYEGHCWERIAFAAARSVNPSIYCVGYHHSILFPRQHAIGLTLGNPYDPDIICTAGNITRKIFEQKYGLNNIKFVTVGTHRRENLKISFENKLIDQSNFACLVIPDGTLSECILIFDFILQAAVVIPNIVFILRLHPVMPLSTLLKKDKRFQLLPKNIIISAESIDKDFERCRWALYRGSGAAIRAMANGLRPLYLKLPAETLSIDPLYMINSWKRVVEGADDLRSIFELDLSNSVENIEQELKQIIDFARHYYTPLDLDLFSRSVTGQL